MSGTADFTRNKACLDFDGQVVLVFEGGGALGAYQAGVYEALHEAGVEPDWVIGTSIGAINAALIAGNARSKRLARLNAFWQRVQLPDPPWPEDVPWAQEAQNIEVVTQGVPGFFRPNPLAMVNAQARVGTYRAAWYSTAPLADTLARLVDLGRLNDPSTTRISLGAVNVLRGRMRYFDSRDEKISLAEVMASGALPPAFPPVEVDGEPYWDGGIYSNTPVEAVMDDRPRRNSLIFAAHLWQAEGEAPQSVWESQARQKDIQYGSRLDQHVEEERRLHRLRRVINLLGRELDPAVRDEPGVRELLSWGCSTTMHLVRLYAPRLAGEDQYKDIDFSARGIRLRREAGYLNMRKMLDERPWQRHTSPLEGVVVHGAPEQAVRPAGM